MLSHLNKDNRRAKKQVFFRKHLIIKKIIKNTLSRHVWKVWNGCGIIPQNVVERMWKLIRLACGLYVIYPCRNGQVCCKESCGLCRAAVQSWSYCLRWHEGRLLSVLSPLTRCATDGFPALPDGWTVAGLLGRCIVRPREVPHGGPRF